MNVVILGNKELIDTLKKRAEEVVGAIDKAGSTTALRVEGDARKNCPKYTGNLAGSIEREKVGDGYVVGTNVPYAKRVEYGGMPTDTSYRDILKWIEKKGIATDNPKRMAYFTAKKITREGTKPQPFLYPALQKNQ